MSRKEIFIPGLEGEEGRWVSPEEEVARLQQKIESGGQLTEPEVERLRQLKTDIEDGKRAKVEERAKELGKQLRKSDLPRQDTSRLRRELDEANARLLEIRRAELTPEIERLKKKRIALGNLSPEETVRLQKLVRESQGIEEPEPGSQRYL